MHTGTWDESLADRLGIPRRLLPALVGPGATIGTLLPAVAADLGAAPGLPVTAVGSHDTASAVAAVPATGPGFAYISSGTWSLVGVELEHPVVTHASREANFTNEGGVDGRIRFLRNVSGLWLLSESVRTWERESGETINLPTLLSAAAVVSHPVHVFDAGDPDFLAPGDLPGRIARWFTSRGLAAPEGRVAVVRSILESLAEAYAEAIRQAASLSGTPVEVVHIVGGGSQNTLLCQLTADRTCLPVLAGPVEATALGNVLVQARAQGLVSPAASLEELRNLVARAFPPQRFLPQLG